MTINKRVQINWNREQTSLDKEVILASEWVKEDVVKVSRKINYTPKEIQEVLWERKVKTRITYLRHFPYDETREEVKEYNILLEKLRKKIITEDEKKRINELSSIVDKLICTDFKEMKVGEYISYEQIKELLNNPERTLLAYYDSEEWMQRCRITGKSLAIKFEVENKQHVNLPWSDKTVDTGKEYAEKPWEISKVVTELENLNQDNKYENIIIIWNRSYSHWMSLLWAEWNISLRWSICRFEEELYDFIDYNSNHKKINNKDILKITLSNYLKLKQIFPEIEYSSMIDFQNKLNVYFIKNTELFKRDEYLYSDVIELRIFCLIKLIKNKEIKILNELFADKEYIDLVKEIKVKLSKEEENIIRYYLEVYPQVIETRERSLDKRIKEWVDINPHFNFSHSEYIGNPIELIKSWKPIKYIEWKAWSWKSYLLLYILEALNELILISQNLVKPYYPVYINLSWKKLDIIQELNHAIYENYQVVYLFDSIDESDIKWEENRKKLDEKLLELSKNTKVIITSRKGYLQTYDEEKDEGKQQKKIIERNQEIIEIQDFTKENIDDYLRKYFHNNEKKIASTQTILEKLNGAWNNPLVLCMVCELVASDEVLEIGQINIIELYERIVKRRLVDFNVWKNKERKINKESYLKQIYSGLGKIAYLQIIENEKITSLDEYISLPNDDAIEWVNLLFRKNTETQEFDFVHQSFKEYFAAKYIFDEMKSEPDFNYEWFLCQELKKVDTNFLEMLVNFIKTDEELKEKFLKQIDENENYFSQTIHHKIVYLLGKLDEGMMNEYLQRIELSQENIEILYILILDNKKLYIKDFLKKTFLQKDYQLLISEKLYLLWETKFLEEYIKKTYNDYNIPADIIKIFSYVSTEFLLEIIQQTHFFYVIKTVYYFLRERLGSDVKEIDFLVDIWESIISELNEKNIKWEKYIDFLNEWYFLNQSQYLYYVDLYLTQSVINEDYRGQTLILNILQKRSFQNINQVIDILKRNISRDLARSYIQTLRKVLTDDTRFQQEIYNVFFHTNDIYIKLFCLSQYSDILNSDELFHFFKENYTYVKWHFFENEFLKIFLERNSKEIFDFFMQLYINNDSKYPDIVLAILWKNFDASYKHIYIEGILSWSPEICEISIDIISRNFSHFGIDFFIEKFYSNSNYLINNAILEVFLRAGIEQSKLIKVCENKLFYLLENFESIDRPIIYDILKVLIILLWEQVELVVYKILELESIDKNEKTSFLSHILEYANKRNIKISWKLHKLLLKDFSICENNFQFAIHGMSNSEIEEIIDGYTQRDNDIEKLLYCLDIINWTDYKYNKRILHTLTEYIIKIFNIHKKEYFDYDSTWDDDIPNKEKLLISYYELYGEKELMVLLSKLSMNFYNLEIIEQILHMYNSHFWWKFTTDMIKGFITGWIIKNEYKRIFLKLLQQIWWKENNLFIEQHKHLLEDNN